MDNMVMRILRAIFAFIRAFIKVPTTPKVLLSDSTDATVMSDTSDITPMFCTTYRTLTFVATLPLVTTGPAGGPAKSV